ncbi:hypothetical protein DH2020_048980 [Rehmannia glutinosa]|uniref:Protein kinase domain-containing protein n=1 Tax=Rehmannia glutinosa TaxID=99300 RepID=A0ABR0U446_REHGL
MKPLDFLQINHFRLQFIGNLNFGLRLLLPKKIVVGVVVHRGSGEYAFGFFEALRKTVISFLYSSSISGSGYLALDFFGTCWTSCMESSGASGGRRRMGLVSIFHGPAARDGGGSERKGGLRMRLNEGSDQRKKASAEVDFFTEYGEGSRYRIEEVIGKGSYGVVCSAFDTHLGEKVAIKKINDIFEHVSDATRILREIKLLRLLRHPDIVEIKHILLPPSRREFKDIYVVFELMESDLHQVIKANDDLTPEHYQFFLYQLLRGLKYIHTANVFHRDLKPKNILANADCKLKICDFGLARVAFNDTPMAIFWTYTPAIDIWSIGCIFAELLTGKPLFPGKNVVHQLDLMTDLLGTPPPETIARVCSYDEILFGKMLAFDPKDRPTAEEALADPYFRSLARVEREPSAQPVTKMEFEFERRRITKDDVRELIYREILEYHPKMLKEFLEELNLQALCILANRTNLKVIPPSAVDKFKKQFAHLEEHYGNGSAAPPQRQHSSSLPRHRPCVLQSDNANPSPDDVANDLSKCSIKEVEKPQIDRSSIPPMARFPAQVRKNQRLAARPGKVIGPMLHYNNCGATTASIETNEQRKTLRTSGMPAQYIVPSSSYPRKHPSCKNEGEEDRMEGSNSMQPKPDLYVARKVAAAQGRTGSHW